MSRFDARFTAYLQALDARHAHRRLRTGTPLPGGRLERDGRRLIDFSSNDYLGLRHHPLLKQRAAEWTTIYGAGSGASRLVTGTLDAHTAVEARIAALKGTEAAVILNSGWQANAAVLPALFDREVLGAPPLVFTDRLNHASLHMGCKAAGVRQIRFHHNDLDHLESLLAERHGDAGARFIVTESVFSMDGDRAPVAGLAALAERHDAFLYLDEAHATGVLGPGGKGLSAEAPGGIDMIMGTFSKALGGFGAYVAGSRAVCELVVNRSSGFIYATALPPAVLGAMDAALELLPQLDAERAHVQALAGTLRQGLGALGYDTGGSTTQIVPAIVGGEAETLALSRRLEDAGFLGIAIRPPTVPPGTARIRFALSAAHSPDDVAALLAVLAEVGR